MRGKVLGASKGCDGVGITPACAGKSASHGCGSRGWRDHPRVCGEKCYNGVVKIFSRGSPPRMRGKADEDFLRHCWQRITPAYAGKSNPLITNQLRCHGSPPRMRGKDPLESVFDQLSGITPAYAGKRRRTADGSISNGDHPRVCGEKATWSPPSTTQAGSPPRMRGKD